MRRLPSWMERYTDWTRVPLGHWLALAGKAITRETLWAEEWRRHERQAGS